IYNYVELREELKSRGHRFRTTSDTEVVLRMYLEYGTDAIRRLNGMFAFLLYDPARGRVVAARDHFGITPLYFTRAAGQLLFASEIKALLRHPAVRAEADGEALQEYFTFQLVLDDRTMFRNVHKVRPGTYHVIDLSSGTTRITCFWEPRFDVDTSHTESWFTERLRHLLDDSIRLQLRSDVPVGAYLSGGTDSSLIATLASKHLGGPLDVFTGAFQEGPQFDETPYARMVAERTGARLHMVHPTEDQFLEVLPALVRSMDEPAAGPGLFPQYAVAACASRHVKVMLGGQGGDELFGGYTRYVVAYLEQAIKGAIFESNEEGEHIVSLKSILPNLPYLREYVPMLQGFWRADIFEPMDRRYFRLIDRSGGALSLLTRQFRKAYDREGIFERFQQTFNHPDTLSYFNKMAHFDMVAGLPALLHVEDRVSMAVSVESRVPLLDHRIADLVASMPPAMKFKGAEMKYILKQAAGDLLPPAIRDRRDKMGFPVPLHLWMQGRLGEYARDMLLGPDARTRHIFDAGEIEKMMNYERAYGRSLWGALNLELWHREFLSP
ncbi:MAG: asparagine synthase (glutamine-hydrolyzing), partial [Gemmatimonadales bacterium]